MGFVVDGVPDDCVLDACCEGGADRKNKPAVPCAHKLLHCELSARVSREVCGAEGAPVRDSGGLDPRGYVVVDDVCAAPGRFFREVEPGVEQHGHGADGLGAADADWLCCLAHRAF